MKRTSFLLSLLISNPLLAHTALAQTAPPPNGLNTGLNTGLTAKQLLEQARQRLRDRGELPPENAPIVQSPLQIPASIPIAPMLAPPPIPAFGTYRLGQGDSVAIYVQRFQDFNFQATIDAEGKIYIFSRLIFHKIVYASHL